MEFSRQLLMEKQSVVCKMVVVYGLVDALVGRKGIIKTNIAFSLHMCQAIVDISRYRVIAMITVNKTETVVP